MRLDPKDDKKLQSNLRTLLLCSQFKTIQHSNTLRKIQNLQLATLDNPENRDLTDYLTRIYEEQNRRNNPKAYLIKPTLHDLSSLKIPDDAYVPDELIKKVHTHQTRVRKIDEISQARDEHDELRTLLYAGSPSGRIDHKRIDLKALKRFLRDKEHSSRFQSFGDSMLHGNQAVTLFRYRNSAKKLAKDEEISDQYFVDRINQTFSAETVKLNLNKEMKGRFFPAAAKITAIALTAFLAINGAVNLFGHKDVTQGTVDTHQTQIVDTLSDQPTADDIISQTIDNPETPNTDSPEIQPPISNSVKIDSYESAADDLFEKVEEIYNYNTGNNVDLSDLNYENIGQSETSVLVANYNGREYRFSTMSNTRTNRANLEKALEAAGATFTSYSTKISYLTRDGQSIAIVDSHGNPIQSGKVLQTSYNGGYEMYNQSYVNSAREMMRQNGISPDGKSEAELIGYYMLNREPAQNDELSKALGTVTPLVDFMKFSFYYNSNGNSDPYTVQQYATKSHKLAEEFNNSALGITQNVDSQNQDRDER